MTNVKLFSMIASLMLALFVPSALDVLPLTLAAAQLALRPKTTMLVPSAQLLARVVALSP